MAPSPDLKRRKRLILTFNMILTLYVLSNWNYCRYSVFTIYVTGNVWNQAFYRLPRHSIECLVPHIACNIYVYDPTPRGATVAIGKPQSGLAREREVRPGIVVRVLGEGRERGRWNFGNVCRPRTCQGRPTKVIQWSRSGPGSRPGPVGGKRGGGAESGIAPEAWGDMAGVKADSP